MSAPTTDQIQSVVTFLTKAAFHLSAAPTNTSKSSFSSSLAPFGKLMQMDHSDILFGKTSDRWKGP